MYALSRYEEAKNAYEHAIVKGDTTFDTQFKYCTALMSLGKQKETLKTCKRLESHAENDGRVQCLKALCLLDIGKLIEAEHEAEKVEQLLNENEEIYFNLIQLFTRLKRYDKVLTYWWFAQRKSWTSYDLSLPVLIECMQYLAKNKPDSDLLDFLRQVRKTQQHRETVLLNLAICADRTGIKEEALEVFNELLQLNPFNLTAAEIRAEMLIQMGTETDVLSSSASFYEGHQSWIVSLYISLAYKAKKNLTKAADHFLMAIKAYPDPTSFINPTIKELVPFIEEVGIRSQIENHLGVTSGQFPRHPAELHFSAFLTSDDNDRLKRLRTAYECASERLLLACDLAMAEFFSGNKEKAIELARKIAGTEAASAFHMVGAGKVLFLANVPPKETLDIAEKVLLKTDCDQDSQWRAHCLKADSLNLLRKYEEALLIGQKALELNRSSFTFLSVLRSLQGLNRTKEALRLVEKALKMFPNEIELKTWNALLLNLEGRNKECIKFVKSMGATGSFMISPILDMADCLVREKRYEEALKCYSSARKNIESFTNIRGIEDYYNRAIRGETNTLVVQRKKSTAIKLLNSGSS